MVGRALARTALMDFGWPEKPMDTERCAVIIGNAIGGEKHYATNMRIQFPEFERELRAAPSFASLPSRCASRSSRRRTSPSTC